MARIQAPPTEEYVARAPERARASELRRLRTKPVWTPQDRDDALRILLDAELARSER